MAHCKAISRRQPAGLSSLTMAPSPPAQRGSALQAMQLRGVGSSSCCITWGLGLLSPPVPGVHPLPVVRWEFGCSTLLQPSRVQRINEGEAIAGLEAEMLGAAGTRLQEAVLANPALFTALKHLLLLLLSLLFPSITFCFSRNQIFFLFLLLLQPKWRSIGSMEHGNL